MQSSGYIAIYHTDKVSKFSSTRRLKSSTKIMKFTIVASTLLILMLQFSCLNAHDQSESSDVTNMKFDLKRFMSYVPLKKSSIMNDENAITVKMQTIDDTLLQLQQLLKDLIEELARLRSQQVSAWSRRCKCKRG